MKLFLFLLVSFSFLFFSCEKESANLLDELDLKSEFPDALFSFDFNFITTVSNASVGEKDILFPTPDSDTSFGSFKATSEVLVEDNIRFVNARLNQGFHAVDSIVDKNVWIPEFDFNIKLNMEASGDVPFKELFKKEELLDFLTIGKEFNGGQDTVGSIEIQGFWKSNSPFEVGHTFYFGIDKHQNIGDGEYTVTIVDVEDYSDLKRNDDLIKEALKVTISFTGDIGVSSDPTLDASEKIDQLSVEEGKAVFLVDFL